MSTSQLITAGDHPALDFINSVSTSPTDTFELLTDGTAYLRWMELAGLITTDERIAADEAFDAAQLGQVLVDAVDLREWARPVIARWAATGDVDEETTARLNTAMRRDHRYLELSREEGRLTVRDHRRWASAGSLLAPPAVAVAELFASGDPDLVRNCDGTNCSMWFYDRTRAHRRRWCTMTICGNRAKARAFRDRAKARPDVGATIGPADA